MITFNLLPKAIHCRASFGYHIACEERAPVCDRPPDLLAGRSRPSPFVDSLAGQVGTQGSIRGSLGQALLVEQSGQPPQKIQQAGMDRQPPTEKFCCQVSQGSSWQAETK